MDSTLDIGRWSGKTALITGASSGSGRAIARSLSRAGLRVILWARRADRLKDLENELSPTNTEVYSSSIDLRDTGAILNGFNEIRERWGGIDVLVNCAGLGIYSPLLTGDTEIWREMLEVNVLALSVCTREAIKDMRKRGDNGHIIHISSIAGHRVPFQSGVYAASKFAVRALTEGLRQELRDAGSQIRVSSISPGMVETEFGDSYYASKELADEKQSQFPVLQPEDIASLVDHFLSQPPHVELHDVILRPTQQIK